MAPPSTVLIVASSKIVENLFKASLWSRAAL